MSICINLVHDILVHHLNNKTNQLFKPLLSEVRGVNNFAGIINIKITTNKWQKSK